MAVTEVDSIGLTRRPIARAETGTPPALLFLFMLSLMLPVILNFGPFALSPSRLLVLLSFFPCLALWVMGRAGKFRLLDFGILFAAAWAALTVLINHGIAAGYERAGFIVVEMVGGYFFGRTVVRNVKDFRTYMKLAVLALFFMLPFGLLETQTGDPIIIDVLAKFIETESVIDHEIRLGLERAQVIFPHPILYGIFCAAMLGPIVRGLNYSASTFNGMIRIGVVLLNTICSVSSGAWLLFLIQTSFLMYDRIMRFMQKRWLLLLVGVVTIFVAIDLAANSGAIKVFVRYFTLNSATGHYRIMQFDWGAFNVMNNPIFGLGYKDWVRPRWMIPSIDNYWMVLAVRHGLPMFLVFLGAILLTMYRMSKLRPADPEVREFRAGYLIALGSFLIAVISVHVWSNMNVWFMFFLGAGIWIFDAQQGEPEEEALPQTAPRGRPAPRENGVQPSPRAVVAPTARKASDPVEPKVSETRYSRFPVKSRPTPTGPGKRKRR